MAGDGTALPVWTARPRAGREEQLILDTVFEHPNISEVN